MSQTLCFFTLPLSFLFFSRASALYGVYVARCQFSSPDGHDAVYLEQYYFNQVLEAQFNGTLRKVIGYTKKAQEAADRLNKNPAFMAQEIWKTEFCRRNSHVAFETLLTRYVEPYVRLKSVEAVGSEHPGMLLCSVYDFYPKQIRVTWLRNGKEVTSDVTSTEELPSGNWLYQIHSYLEYTPTPGEKITCMVEHASFVEPRRYDWDPMPESRVNKIAVGTAGLLLGLIFSVAGLIYYKMSPTGQVLVPTTEGGHLH